MTHVPVIWLDLPAERARLLNLALNRSGASGTSHSSRGSSSSSRTRSTSRSRARCGPPGCASAPRPSTSTLPWRTCGSR
jgi:hypothetical protein